MLDEQQRAIWYDVYRTEAFKLVRGRAARKAAEQWARSMSLIAEQFVEDDGDELVDAE